LVLAALAVLLRRDARTKFWTVTAVVCLLLALGRYAPLGFYKLIYFAPILNLFRVPARHLMEVEFALAVLAGRGLTVIAAMRGDAKVARRAATVGACVFLLTCIVVTWGRPDDFKLGRQAAEVSVMRAPELFLPVVFAALGAFAVWTLARARRRGASVMLLVVLALDLVVWGQSSGWRASSPTFDFELWGEPETVRYLRERETQAVGAPFRILTEDQPFDPDLPVATLPAGARWLPTLQPDVYMMYGIENAAGYDGFGLARYSRLAGDMKVWGELTDAERTLRGESRELDLLNVRYLLTRPLAGATVGTSAASAAPSSSSDVSSTNAPPSSPSATPSSSNAPPVAQNFPEASQVFGGHGFASGDLNVPSVGARARLSFVVPPIEADRVALVTNLAWSVDVPDGTTVARVRLKAEGGKSFDFELRAGEHTSEWAFDRADIRAQIKHRRAPVATSYAVEDAQGRYEAHSYVASFALPERAVIEGGEIAVVRVERAPELTLSVLRASLLDEAGGKAFPLRREWLKKESAQAATQTASQSSSQPSSHSSGRSSNQSLKSSDKNPASASSQSSAQARESEGATPPRWRRLARLGDVAVYENTRAMPRAWLASDALVLGEEQMLNVIRTGKLPDGAEWNPLRTALVEAPVDFKQADAVDASARAEVAGREANRIEVKTNSAAPSILVLSENHFPGWRAYVDGRAAETLRVDYNLRGVVLAAGAHTVEFVYRPKSVLIGFIVSLLTLVALLVWAARIRIARRPRIADAGRDRDD
ncbi:MAG TPA: YfhO family protein, partial [Pyrinomonadaceae bacterium]|nr:YfhO family protein [Pyrinomonadaceae bacterium]